ncbi:Gfo/Idh/MocA family protein [Segetibacter aerophilus]|uniref:Oxidoreductase n=1 Tax=Segetibacter aerophilus TaxID=670293 RepID=A0A512BDF5_9BACT|nr:Gfo/Idh/MocA family oxidoreductase [Segetibacter aerophilus]GEO09925.1 oxidoreductase [Segetibacter aerophilus]
MKILLIGLGSIGRRHLRNLLTLGYNQISVVSRSATLPAEFDFLRVYSSLQDALSSSVFDTAIICTPTSLHLASASILLHAKIPNIYLEKPVSHSYNGIEDLLALAASYESNIVVGYDLHFDPGMQKVHELLAENVIGKVVSVNAFVGQFLPDWRPAEDYTKGMSAKKETGGGVMLDLVHEFDYLLWLLGPVETVASQYSNTGALQIETEDVCDVLLKFDNGATGTLHLDYLQKKLVRNCTITGFNGAITCNLAENKVSWINKDKQEEEFEYKGFERNGRFIQIMKAFLENKKDARLTSLQQGIESLKLVLAAKRSSEKARFVTLNTFNPSAS